MALSDLEFQEKLIKHLEPYNVRYNTDVPGALFFTAYGPHGSETTVFYYGWGTVKVITAYATPISFAEDQECSRFHGEFKSTLLSFLSNAGIKLEDLL